MERIYKYFRWLSLDIVLGAIFFLLYLEQYYRVAFAFSVYFALASAIWLIYTCDHLIDAKKVKSPSSYRHRFHQKHYSRLVFIGGLVLITALINVYFLPEMLIKGGAALSALCIGYLMLVFFYKKLWVKELLVALVYAVGIFLAPLVLKGGLVFNDVMLVFQLFLVAFLNLMIFSCYDADKDAKDGFNSLVIRLGLKKSSLVIHFIVVLSVASSALLYITGKSDIQLLYFGMSILLYSLHILPSFYSVNERFRTMGDGVFYLPAVFLLLYL